MVLVIDNENLPEIGGEILVAAQIVEHVADGPMGGHRDQVALHQAACGLLRKGQSFFDRGAIVGLHRAKDGAVAVEMAAEWIILPRDESGEADEADDAGANGHGEAPAIVAESDTKIQTMTVSMAVMQLELADLPAMMFRSAAHGRLNMVYRRPDGNVGWVDPGKDG